MGTPSRVFVARLAGVAVFDPDGGFVGKIRDVVVALRTGDQPPQVLGLVVEMQHRRRIFVPIGRVTSLEADAVGLSTGSVNLRRFEQRPGETLVLAELLDRRVTLAQSNTNAVVVDAAMEQTRGKEWQLSRIATRDMPTGRFNRRRRNVSQFEWHDVRGLFQAEPDQGAEHLIALLNTMPAADVAAVVHDLSDKRRTEVAWALDDERLADVLQELPDEDQIEIIAKLEAERAADVLEAMDPDDAADLLGALPSGEQERLLTLMEPQEAEPVRRLMSYSEGTAGSLMTTDPVILVPDATVAQALARVREQQLTPALASQVYVCRPPSATPTGRYLGVAHIQRLLREAPSTLVSGIIEDDIDPLHPTTPLADVARYFAIYDLLAIAVVDDSDRLVGAITVDDLLDALLPADWRERDG